ncbi:hypothetical protein [Streptosporangium canum]|uniref:hypothetical protein n=1 Tax=Streptosporangium canum TaxID=324952 RepID=UPI00379D8005
MRPRAGPRRRRGALDVSRPKANTRWTESEDAHKARELKHRAPEDTRPVPIPPVLVKILREHPDGFGTAKDGRLFPSERGGVVASTACTEMWAAARLLALTPEQAASPLLALTLEQAASPLPRRPYDLRHAAVSLWLNAEVPTPEAARPAGHGADVLLRVYAQCIDGQAEGVNRRIDDALAA